MSADDVRETPPELFAALHARFRFTLDACATPQNAKLPRFNSEAEPDRFSWAGERVWCNPPFSDIRTWCVRAVTDGAELAVLLVPATRTDQPWWHELIEPFRDRGQGLRTEFLRGRTRFLKDEQRMGSPKFGCVLLIFGDT